MFTIKELGDIDISDLSNKIMREPEESWNKYTFRQNSYDVHRNTKTIPVIWSSSSDHHTLDGIVKYEITEYNHYTPYIDSIVSKLYSNCVVLKTAFVMLRPNSIIPLHTDNPRCLTESHRIHIPIITNENVLFQVDNDTLNMKSGKIYEINNKLLHGVFNNSSKSRIHLMIDLLPEKLLNYEIPCKKR